MVMAARTGRCLSAARRRECFCGRSGRLFGKCSSSISSKLEALRSLPDIIIGCAELSVCCGRIGELRIDICLVMKMLCRCDKGVEKDAGNNEE